MSLRVVLRRAAEEEVAYAAEWYDRESSGLGTEFLVEVHAAITRASERPELYALAYRDLRRCATHRFPYNIYFRVRGAVLVVVAVFHGSRDPRHWHHRT